MINNLLQIHIKLLQKERFKKQQEQLAILLVTEPMTELYKFQKLRQRIIQQQMKKIY